MTGAILLVLVVGDVVIGKCPAGVVVMTFVVSNILLSAVVAVVVCILVNIHRDYGVVLFRSILFLFVAV